MRFVGLEHKHLSCHWRLAPFRSLYYLSVQNSGSLTSKNKKKNLKDSKKILYEGNQSMESRLLHCSNIFEGNEFGSRSILVNCIR